MISINKFLFEKLNLNTDSKITPQQPYKPMQGEHDKSVVYDDIWNDIKDHLERWGAGPVYGWKRNQGVAFSVTKGKNVKKDDWIVIQYNIEYDDFTIFLSKHGSDEQRDIKDSVAMVYLGQEPMVIDELLGIKNNGR